MSTSAHKKGGTHKEKTLIKIQNSISDKKIIGKTKTENYKQGKQEAARRRVVESIGWEGVCR